VTAVVVHAVLSKLFPAKETILDAPIIPGESGDIEASIENKSARESGDEKAPEIKI
jgi:hypothetical protein